MRLIPLEEAVDSWPRRLVDLAEFRLSEIEEHGVDVQVLSPTTPAIHIGVHCTTVSNESLRRESKFWKAK
jgi:hypothetical protein